MELTEDTLRISRRLSTLDEDVIDFVDLLEETDVDDAVVGPRGPVDDPGCRVTFSPVRGRSSVW